MAGSAYHKILSLQLDTADDNGICLSQTTVGADDLTINGALASGGVATLDVARRVLVTSDDDDTGITFTITGTDRYGRVQTEVLTGPDTAGVYTEKDFLTVTNIATSGATTGNIIVGTNGIGSTAPLIVDTFINPAMYGVSCVINGSATYTLEVTYDDLAPDFDLNNNTANWFGATGFSGKSANAAGNIEQGPVTMIRLTNTAGTGTVTANIILPLVGGRF